MRDKVWHESDVILPDTKENKRFEDVVHHVFGQLDFSEISRDQLYVTAYDYIVSQGYEERDIGLFLSLFESSLNVLEVVERQRVDLLGILEGELLEQKKITTPGERDEDLIKQLSVEVEVIKNGTRLRIHKLMQDYLESDLKTAEREKNPFAGPYVRLLLDKQSGNRRYTDKLKEQLAELFRTSIHAIAAMKAWKSG